MSESNVVEFCINCGSLGSMEEIRERSPGALSCCPERKTVDMIKYMCERDTLKTALTEAEAQRDEYKKQNEALDGEIRGIRKIAKQRAVSEGYQFNRVLAQRDAAVGKLERIKTLCEQTVREGAAVHGAAVVAAEALIASLEEKGGA